MLWNEKLHKKFFKSRLRRWWRRQKRWKYCRKHSVTCTNLLSRKQEKDAQYTVLVLQSSKLFFCISLIVDALNLSLRISRRIMVLNFLLFHCGNHCMIGFERNQSLREDSLSRFGKVAPFTPWFLRVFHISKFSLDTLWEGMSVWFTGFSVVVSSHSPLGWNVSPIEPLLDLLNFERKKKQIASSQFTAKYPLDRSPLFNIYKEFVCLCLGQSSGADDHFKPWNRIHKYWNNKPDHKVCFVSFTSLFIMIKYSI